MSYMTFRYSLGQQIFNTINKHSHIQRVSEKQVGLLLDDEESY